MKKWTQEEITLLEELLFKGLTYKEIGDELGFENNIDPKIISHPANCQLLIHSDNSSKNRKSDISIEELLQKIKLWELNKI